MKSKIILFILFFIFLFAGFIYFLSKEKKQQTNNSILGSVTVSYTLNNKHLNLLVADTQEKWMTGLMDKKKLDGADGMIFIFPDSQPRSFWNKNTYLDLDIYWMNNDAVVGKVLLPSIEKTGSVMTVSSPSPVNAVIELVRKK